MVALIRAGARVRAWGMAVALGWAAVSAQALPAQLKAERARALPAGQWLVQDDKAVRLLNPAGHELARLSLRSEGLDVRVSGARGVAVVANRDTREIQPVVVDVAQGLLQTLPALDTGELVPETACLHRDAQGLVHAVVLGAEGQAQQWLVDEGGSRLIRRLALAPGAELCEIDDATATLFLPEPGVGLWAYGLTQDAPMQRTLVAREVPQRPQLADPEALLSVQGAVVLLADDGRQLRAWARAPRGAWRTWLLPRLPRAADALALQTTARGPLLWWRDAEAGTWASMRLAAMPAMGASPQRVPFVQAVAQTEAVASRGDAADDPAIWVHASRPEASRVLGTNKKHGLEVYALDGRLLQRLPVGRVNNVDVRQGVRLNEGAPLDIAAASNRSDNTITLWSIDAQGELTERGRIASGLDEVYGLCLYKPEAGGLHVFINDKDGRIRQFALSIDAGQWQGRLLREFALSSQPEGCVVDDRQARVFLGEEDRGVWAVSANPEHEPRAQRVASVGAQLKADVEGLGLYHGPRHSYLVVSSQGDHSFVLFEARPPYRWVGKLRVGINPGQGIDAVAETDGLEATSAPLGGAFGQGALVVQDGYKRMPDGHQNFKFIPWAEVQRALHLPD